jgi:hypothetical protein
MTLCPPSFMPLLRATATHRARWQRFWQVLLAALIGLLVAACGGGSDDSPPPPLAAVTLAGTAATGGALAGGSLRVIDRNGDTRTLGVPIGSDGAFSLDITGLTAPLLVIAEGRVGESTAQLFALEPTGATSGTIVVNVTPLTNAVTALLAPNFSPLAFTQATTLAGITATQVDEVVRATSTALAASYTAAGITGAGFNPMSTPFAIGQAGQDRLLEALRFEIAAQGVIVTNTALPLSAIGVPQTGAVVTLTPANLAAPPALSAGTGAIAVETLGALRQPLDNCFVVAATQRATSATCAGLFAPGYFADGADAAQRWLGADPALDNARFASPELLYVQTDINGFPAPVVRLRWTQANGDIGSRIEVLGNGGTASAPLWRLYGNQRNIDVLLEPRLARNLERNPAFNGNLYLTQLRVLVNLAGPRGNEIARARIRGPGLPAAGVLYARSTACGTDTYLAIHNDAGATADSTAQTQNNYALSFANVDPARPVTWPGTSVTYRDTPMSAAELAAVRPGVQYAVDVWFRDPTTKAIAASPVSYAVPLNVPLPAPELGARLPWSAPTTATLDALLNATSAQTASATIDYARAAGAEPVRSVYLFSSKPDPLFNPPALTDTANPLFGSRLRVLGQALNLASSATSGSVSAGTLQRGVDFAIGGVNLPSCAASQFAAMTDAGAYREIAVNSIMSDGLRRQTLFTYNR